MNPLDVVVLVLATVAVVGGWRMGFLRRLTGWVGTAVGLGLAIVMAPGLVERLGLDSDVLILLVGTALFILLASLGQGLGAAVGARLRAEVDSDAGRRVDAVGGSVLGVAAVVVLVWLVVPVMAETEGWASASARGSTVARLVDEHLPPPPPQIADLERQLVGGAAPQLFEGLRRAPEIPPAPTGSPVAQEVLDRAAPSAVRVQGDACGRLQSGSGFVVAPGLVVTNAHVVAGTDGLTLRTADGRTADGTVVAYEPATDLALVGTDLDRPPLPVADPAVGDAGLVLGFPGGGPFEPSPFQVGDVFDATGYDIYDRATVDRELLALAAELAPGDSGSAVLRSDGAVVGVAVAIAPDRAQVAYALDVSELQELLGRGVDGAVDTGACTR